MILRKIIYQSILLGVSVYCVFTDRWQQALYFLCLVILDNQSNKNK